MFSSSAAYAASQAPKHLDVTISQFKPEEYAHNYAHLDWGKSATHSNSANMLCCVALCCAVLCYAMLQNPDAQQSGASTSSCAKPKLFSKSVLLAAYLQVTSAKAKLEKSVSGDAFPLDYSTSMRVIRDALHGVSPAPVVVSEGANTMDNARSALRLPGCCCLDFPLLFSLNPFPAVPPFRMS